MHAQRLQAQKSLHRSSDIQQKNNVFISDKHKECTRTAQSLIRLSFHVVGPGLTYSAMIDTGGGLGEEKFC